MWSVWWKYAVAVSLSLDSDSVRFGKGSWLLSSSGISPNPVVGVGVVGEGGREWNRVASKSRSMRCDGGGDKRATKLRPRVVRGVGVVG